MGTEQPSTGSNSMSFVDVCGRRLAFRQAGQARSAVVFEMGLGVVGDTYDDIAQRVAAFARVVWYDHAGPGCSDPAPTPRTIPDLAADLHTLLHAALIPPPYVLAGHSLRELTVRYSQQRYPAAVAALVLVDAAHEEQRERLLAALPPESPDEVPGIAHYRTARSARWADPMANEEGIDNLANTALMRQSGSPGDLPLVVVSRGQAQAPAGLPLDLVARREQAWRQMERDLAALSSRTVHMIAEHSGHLIHNEQPDIIVSGIRQALALAPGHEHRISGNETS